jgi:hypothetical protein
MTEYTPNKWPVLHAGDNRLVVGVVPGANRHLTVRYDQLGFLVLYWAAFWNEKVERLDAPRSDAVDEGCWADRANTTAHAVKSEHSGAAAVDLNWNRHPQGVPIAHTFTAAQIATIRQGIKWLNRLALGKVAEWGGEWPTHPGSTAKTDGMHTQFYPGRVLFLVRRVLLKTKRGKAVLKANPHLRIKGVTI